MNTIKKLNLGCGTDIKEGWINLDSAKLPGVDVVHDLENLPLPFGDNTFNEILCQDILEHTEYIPLLRELHRILIPGGKLIIRVPHFTSKNNFIDPTHKKQFSIETFDHFVAGSPRRERRSYYFDFTFAHIEKRILFELSSRGFFYNRAIEQFVNKRESRQRWYESTALSRLFPAENILVTLSK